MLNGSMFATLHRFEDPKFFKKHDTITVYTPGHQLTYTIVSAYIYDNRHILNTFDFSKKKDLKEYISSLTKPKSMVSNVREGIKVTTKDHILTLSTCTSVDTQRYLVQGVLTDDTITK
jgi:sortase B